MHSLLEEEAIRTKLRVMRSNSSDEEEEAAAAQRAQQTPTTIHNKEELPTSIIIKVSAHYHVYQPSKVV